ncbi:unnamed protein product [Candidula unifasciata]|uniref:G-protein coupled receptors family 1 profile domain-containing protein n=1 Tax=Candidula unifasciata TaxID=100452 RepID=A0A8S4AFP6_9EUPU|nr:unnamed protein product [Candidula unifasciata]
MTFNVSIQNNKDSFIPVVKRYGYFDPRGEPYIIREGNNYVDADPLLDYIHWVIAFIVIPTVSILGIIGNSISLAVLTKHGFSKSSNVLLFSLALSDILFMVGVTGPPKAMYEWGGGGFQYPETTAHVLYYLYHIFDSLNWGSGPPSLFVPVLITIERLIAVFLPLKFTSIVTPKRTAVVVIGTNVVSYGVQIYVRTWFEFVYVFDIARNASVGYAARTAAYWTQRGANKIIAIFVNCLMILVIFVFCGSIAIGIKIKLASIRRLKMTASGKQNSKCDAGTSRTTKMLLCLCFFYAIACAPIGLPVFIPGFMSFPVYTEEPNFHSVGVFIYHIYKLIYCINASINFFIYVLMSRSFRKTFLGLIPCINTNQENSQTNSAELSHSRTTNRD